MLRPPWILTLRDTCEETHPTHSDHLFWKGEGGRGEGKERKGFCLEILLHPSMLSSYPKSRGENGLGGKKEKRREKEKMAH